MIYLVLASLTSSHRPPASLLLLLRTTSLQNINPQVLPLGSALGDLKQEQMANVKQALGRWTFFGQDTSPAE